MGAKGSAKALNCNSGRREQYAAMIQDCIIFRSLCKATIVRVQKQKRDEGVFKLLLSSLLSLEAIGVRRVIQGA